MKILVRSLALACAAALALPALADDAVVAEVAPAAETTAVLEAAQLDPALDVAVVEQATATETNELGLSPSVTTGLIFLVVSFALFSVATDGPAQN